VRKPDSRFRRLIYSWFSGGERAGPDQAGKRRLARFGRAALSPPMDTRIGPEIAGLLSELILRGHALRRRMNTGMKGDEQTWKAEIIDWLKRTEPFTMKKRPAMFVKMIPVLNTDINLFRMLIARQLFELKHFKENRVPAEQR
jgi:hypothetical protein